MGEPYIVLSKRTSQEYHKKSVTLRKEALAHYDYLKNNAKTFHVSNSVDLDVEMTYSDIKTIVGKATRDEKFNAIKNALARDIEGYLEKAEYVGWRPVRADKHEEAVYFVYYSRRFGAKTYLCIRKMRDSGKYKPYAIINQDMFNEEAQNLKKEKPPR